MKKLFLFLAVASTTMFVSCGSDDNSGGGTPVDPPVEGPTAITLTASATAVETGTPVTFTVKNNLTPAVDVTSSSTFTVTPATGGTFAGAVFTATTAGTYSIVAKNGDLTSSAVVVTVTAPVVVAGDNSIFINGTNNAIENSILVYWGGWAADPNATEATHILWSLVSFDTASGNTATNFVDVEFVGPLPTGQLELPVSSQVTFNQIYEVAVGGAEVAINSTESGTITFDAWPGATNQPHSFGVTAQYNGGSSMEVNFDGNWLGVSDGTASRPAQKLDRAKAAKNTKVISKTELAKIKAKFFANLNK